MLRFANHPSGMSAVSFLHLPHDSAGDTPLSNIVARRFVIHRSAYRQSRAGRRYADDTGLAMIRQLVYDSGDLSPNVRQNARVVSDVFASKHVDMGFDARLEGKG